MNINSEINAGLHENIVALFYWSSCDFIYFCILLVFNLDVLSTNILLNDYIFTKAQIIAFHLIIIIQ